MTSEQLSHLQGVGSLILMICLTFGFLHLIVGLIRPSLVWRKRRGAVTLVTFALWLIGFLIQGAIIAYTHSHPNGPHAVKGYIDDYLAEQCAQGADLPACRKDGVVPGAAPAGATSPAP